jgi:8-oxo-dGTP pyrophosphatase MutT (NUDIX family)
MLLHSSASEENPWKTLSSEIVYDTPWIAIERNEVINPAGNEGVYSIIQYKNKAIGILPLDEEDYTWIVGQYRYPIKEYSWEIPEGGGPLSDSPLESAARELQEETGIVARSYELLVRLHLSNSASDEEAFIYLARGLSFHESSPEETEQLEVRKVHFDELLEMVMKGSITDAMTVAAVLKYALIRKQNR